MACAMRLIRRTADMSLFSAKNLSVSFDTLDGQVNAVKGVSFDINPGE